MEAKQDAEDNEDLPSPGVSGNDDDSMEGKEEVTMYVNGVTVSLGWKHLIALLCSVVPLAIVWPLIIHKYSHNSPGLQGLSARQFGEAVTGYMIVSGLFALVGAVKDILPVARFLFATIEYVLPMTNATERIEANRILEQRR